LTWQRRSPTTQFPSTQKRSLEAKRGKSPDIESRPVYSAFGYDPSTFTKLQCCVSWSMALAMWLMGQECPWRRGIPCRNVTLPSPNLQGRICSLAGGVFETDREAALRF